MRRLTLLTSILLLLGLNISAQQASPINKLEWDQPAPSLNDAQSYVYRYYEQGIGSPTPLGSATCSGTSSPFSCKVNFPSFLPGPHTIAITASNSFGESGPSNPLSFEFVAGPATPSNLRIVK